MLNKEKEKEKEEVIELFGVHFEKHHNMSPLAARIFATIILNNREKDLTFEELVNITGASKSSVSTNINLLLDTNKITYYTVCGERKKFFKPASLSERIKNHLQIVKSEQNIIKRIKAYETKYNLKALDEKDQKVVELYREYVNDFENLINDLILKIEDLETK
ncbi:GbsR/MarR family transcriptional regulator [Flavobacterium haoranii]|uniref:DNA-binding transcriptional regulator GbsR, MarR family n=1 Tax=Flavobacterium haoranii TaxID=683124 RepID=A0A1M6E7T3_9FLAO|nr:hypothetical protein [Flavobacterium haoranii]SHI81584.1 hypothetical protein SAMN05444337_0873 [Flavobacterium haoranii]